MSLQLSIRGGAIPGLPIALTDDSTILIPANFFFLKIILEFYLRIKTIVYF